MPESGAYAVDIKSVAVAGTPEFLTTRDVLCSTVIIYADDDNTGVVYVVDPITPTKKFPPDGLRAGRWIIVPCTNPRTLRIDVSVSGEQVGWYAI